MRNRYKRKYKEQHSPRSKYLIICAFFLFVLILSCIPHIFSSTIATEPASHAIYYWANGAAIISSIAILFFSILWIIDDWTF